MIAPPPSVITLSTAEHLAEAVAQRLVTHLLWLSQIGGPSFNVFLSGGLAGLGALRHTRANPLINEIRWSQIRFWWAEERWLPSGHPDRFEQAARQALLNHINIPAENVRPMPGPDAFRSAKRAAKAYEAEMGVYPRGFPASVTILDVAEDGHVAGLHNGSRGLEEDAPWVLPSPSGLTITISAIRNSHELWILAAGADKRRAVASFLKYRDLWSHCSCNDIGNAKKNAELEKARNAPANIASESHSTWFIDQAASK